MKSQIHTQKTQRIDSRRAMPVGHLRTYTLLLIGLIAMISAAHALAQPIVITLDESQPLIDSRRDAQTFLSEMTSIGMPDHDMLQALAGQSGAGQNWDLTGYSYGSALSFTNFFRAFDPSNPGGNVPAYQGANCVGEAPAALNPGIPGDNWAYFFIGEGILEQHGNLVVGLVRIEQGPPALERVYPVEFGGAWGSTFTRTIVGGPGTSIIVDESYTVDGWGTLSVPGAGAVPALRIMKTTTVGALPPEPEIQFVTKDGLSASLGFDIGLSRWESVGYTTETITGGGPLRCGDTGQRGVLFVVDDATNLSSADVLARDLMMSLNLEVEILSDDVVTTEDADGRDLIVVSGSADASVIAADWAATAVPLVSWEGGLFDDLQLTGNVQDTDYGVTAATNTLTLVDATHPIANGSSGDIMVSNGDFPMNYGMPSNAAAIVATADGGNATIFTYDTSALLADGSNAPARRVAFYMDADGPANATDDGMTLLKNAILWALGREGDIDMSVAIETVDSDIPDAFQLDQNYPNPFNPTTVIPFSVAATGPVSLSVYNVLGQEVVTLVDEQLPAGNYTADFRADGLPSGVYLYRFKAGSTGNRRFRRLHGLQRRFPDELWHALQRRGYRGDGGRRKRHDLHL